jgi:hypothetical protein
MRRRGVLLFFSIGLAVGVLLLLSGCSILDPAVHEVRISSTVTADLENFKVGPVGFGTVLTGTTTDYFGIEAGVVHDMTFGPEDTVIGTVSVDGLGPHLWTVTIDGTAYEMTFTLTEDGI